MCPNPATAYPILLPPRLLPSVRLLAMCAASEPKIGTDQRYRHAGGRARLGPPAPNAQRISSLPMAKSAFWNTSVPDRSRTAAWNLEPRFVPSKTAPTVAPGVSRSVSE